MSTIHNQSFCVGSQRFDPLQCGKDKVKQHQIIQLLFQNDLFGAVCLMFGLEKSDSYVYHAVASVQLHQAQRIVNMGGLNGLHDWYFDSSGQPVGAAYLPCISDATNSNRIESTTASGRYRCVCFYIQVPNDNRICVAKLS